MIEFVDAIENIPHGPRITSSSAWSKYQLVFPRRSVYGGWLWPWSDVIEYSHTILRTSSPREEFGYTPGIHTETHNFYMTEDEAVMAKIELTM